jgi:transcriptional regulator GlxA family with amidase domain
MTKTGHFVPTRAVGLVVFDGVQILDIAGPVQALATANECNGKVRYETHLVSLGGGLITTASGIPLLTRRLNTSTVYDTVMVPGGPGVFEARRSRKLVDALKRLTGRSRRQCAICTGAFLLAETGRLDGRRVATHWRSCARLADEYPALRVEEDPIYVQDGTVWTTAGVTAGIDLALALIEEDNDATVAIRVARRLVVYFRRPGGQRQFSEPLALQGGGGGAYAALLEAIAQKPARRWNAEDMAAEAGQSLRTFFRRFIAATGCTPARAVERIRCEQAKTLLQSTDLSVGAVARRVGMRSEGNARRALKRVYRLSPLALRRS